LDDEAQRRFIARERANPRARPDLRPATVEQMERGTYPWRMFDPFNLGVPALRVDTTSGYVPDLDTIIAFCREAAPGLVARTGHKLRRPRYGHDAQAASARR
jgi:hypothetical protein